MPPTRLLLLSTALLAAASLPAQTYRTGDFLFQDLDCGPLCDAIEAVTPGLDGRHFSHVGLVEVRGDSTFVWEAISAGGVVRTPLARFVARVPEPAALVHMRLTPKHAVLVPAALRFCESVHRTPYDAVYLLDNDAYYCSELLYDAFRFANGGTAVFELHPMTFKAPATGSFDPAWVTYYQDLGRAIPEGELGCNPGGLATGGLLERVHDSEH